jgi:hypothetical protein
MRVRTLAPLVILCLVACSALSDDPDDYPLTARLNGTTWQSTKVSTADLTIGMSPDHTERTEQLIVRGRAGNATIQLSMRWNSDALPQTFDLAPPDSDALQTAAYNVSAPPSSHTCVDGQVTIHACGRDGGKAKGTFWLTAAIWGDTIRFTDGIFTAKVTDAR